MVAMGVGAVIATGARAGLSENFDASTAVPAGWVNGGSDAWNNAAHYASAPYCRAMGAGDTLQTPPVDFPTNLSFYVDASNAGNNKIATVDYSLDDGGTWNLLASFAVSTVGSTRNYPLTGSPNLAVNPGVRFRFNSTFSTWYLDNAAIQTAGGAPSNAPPFIGLTPAITHWMVQVGDTVSVTVAVTELDGDEVTLSGLNLPAGTEFTPNPLTGPAPLSSVFQWRPAATGVWDIVFRAEDKDGAVDAGMTVTAYVPDPGILLQENFDASTTGPAGWVDGGTANDVVASHCASLPNCRALGSGDTLTTPPVDFPTNLSFYADASNDGHGQTAWVLYRVGTNEWLPLGSFSVRTTGAIESFSLLDLPEAAEAEDVQFQFVSTFSTWYLDDVLVRGRNLANQPPVLTPIGPQLAAPGQTLNLTVSATDFDGHEIILYAADLPPGAGFEAEAGTGVVHGVMTFSPQASDVDRNYTPTFYAEDINGTSEETVTIGVRERLVGFAQAETQVAECAGGVSLAVTLSSSADVTVEVALGGRATPGPAGDYALSTTNLVFTADGPVTRQIDVQVFDDEVREGPEAAVLDLTNAQGAQVGPIGRHVLTVADDEAVFLEPLDVDPGWSMQGAWAFGSPLGGGGDHGNPDPIAGRTGTNVYGYNLAGDYPNNLAGTHYLTTPAIDCTSFCNVQLEFWRWLGVESSQYDQAVIQVSTDRRRWFDVWRHDGSAVTDADWMNVVHDLAGHADGQPAVYIRWGLGPTDSVWSYCGWNLDDVALVGDYVSNAMFRFAAPQFTARETGLTARVTVERVGLTNTTAAIVFTATGGTATADADYEAAEDTLVFAPGERLRVLEFALYNDAAEEGEETVELRLIPTETGDVAAPATATLVIQDDETPGAGLAFLDGFEAETLASDWTAASTGAGRIRVAAGVHPPFEGLRHLCMDAAQNNRYGLNELVLTVDLAGHTNVVLDFLEYNYDSRVEAMPAQFSGSVAADGVAVSGDGWNWRRLLVPESRGSYVPRSVSLSAFAANNGLPLDSHFKVKFQQYDRYPLPTCGRCFDNIQVYDPAQVAEVRLSVTQSEDPVQLGHHLVYVLRVTNAGPLGATGLLVRNDFPPGVTVVAIDSSQGGCTQAEGSVFCELGNLARDASATVTLTVTVPAEPGPIVNRASVWGAIFDPVRTNNVVMTETMVDARGGILQMAAEAVSVEEKAGSVVISVVRTGPTYGLMAVDYATVNDTATAGQDYTAQTGTLYFTNGQTAATIVVPVADDILDEPPETFGVVLSNPGGGAELGTPVETMISLLDDDGRAAFPFHESFESGVLSNCWRTYSSGAGRIQITTNHGPRTGARHLTMDASVNMSNSLNELVLTVDLAGKRGVTLEFWHRQFGDERQLMGSSFSGRQNVDGVAMSTNGVHWVKVQGLTAAEGGSNTYGRFEVALDPIAAAYGLAYTSTFQIKFQQYDNYPIPSDGFAFDDISLFARQGNLCFGQAVYEVSETGGVAVVSIERVNGSLGTVSVHCATADGTATPGRDYVATNGVLVFADGVTTGSFTVPILDDGEDEPMETLGLILSDPTGGSLLVEPGTAVLAIQDDDGPGEFSFAAETFGVSESNATAPIVVWRRSGFEGEARVDYQVSAGTATAGADFVEAAGSLVFGHGVTSRTFTVELCNDLEQEDMETVRLDLLQPSPGAAVGYPSHAWLHILDDEDPNYDYYQTAYGKEGAELRQALHDIIDDHVTFSYDTLWASLQETDECPTNSGQVQLVYMQDGRDKNSNGGESGQWNREHVWPQSHGAGNPMGNGDPSPTWPSSVDAHHLKPSDVQVNSQRGSKDFDSGGNGVPGTPPTCRTTTGTFEPPDASKGDIARAVFYMDVRYAGDAENEPDLELVDAIGTSGTQLGRRSTLIEWHFLDPPDDFERRRNNLIHANWQQNRNPFIDHPEWVLKVWEHNLAIATRTDGAGGIMPANPQVPYHSDQFFEVQPAPYWHIADVRTNGASLDIGPDNAFFSFVWNQVVATGTLEAVFAPNLAPRGTPEWWLADYGFSNEFAAAELSDLDEDGLFAWQEFRAGTRPDDPLSLLAFETIAPDGTGGPAVLRWRSASNRFYNIWRSTNLMADYGRRLATRLPAELPVNAYTDAVEGVETRFYWIEVDP